MNRLVSTSFDVSYTPALGVLSRSEQPIGAGQTQIGAPIVHIGGDMPGVEAAIQKTGLRANRLESLDILSNDRAVGAASCVIIDVSWSALENRALQERLGGLGSEFPFICIVQEASLAMVVALMKLGAVDVLEMPIAAEALMGAVRLGLQNSEAALQKAQAARQVKDRYESLSLRERQVMTLASSGLLNKQIAAELSISEITVKAHRGSLMRKMEARSFASLVRMAMALAL
jgi:FixJ family two-component response regulator